MIRLTLILALIATPATALADPCKAIPDSLKAPMPAYLQLGRPFSGRVVHIVDGDGLCVTASPFPSRPETWVEVRIADFMAPETNEAGGQAAKLALTAIALDARATCIPERGFNGKIRSHDRVIARCMIKGRSIGDLMRAQGIKEGGNGWAR